MRGKRVESQKESEERSSNYVHWTPNMPPTTEVLYLQSDRILNNHTKKLSSQFHGGGSKS